MGHLDDSMMRAVNTAIAVSFGLGGAPAGYGAAVAAANEGAVASVGDGSTTS
jgi:hypothetical protein